MIFIVIDINCDIFVLYNIYFLIYVFKDFKSEIKKTTTAI